MNETDSSVSFFSFIKMELPMFYKSLSELPTYFQKELFWNTTKKQKNINIKDDLQFAGQAIICKETNEVIKIQKELKFLSIETIISLLENSYNSRFIPMIIYGRNHDYYIEGYFPEISVLGMKGGVTLEISVTRRFIPTAFLSFWKRNETYSLFIRTDVIVFAETSMYKLEHSILEGILKHEPQVDGFPKELLDQLPLKLRGGVPAEISGSVLDKLSEISKIAYKWGGTNYPSSVSFSRKAFTYYKNLRSYYAI